jgi:hypothetical protein
MNKTISSIKIGLIVCGLALAAYSELKSVVLFVNTADGAIGHRQATESFETMMKELSEEHNFTLTIQNGRGNASWPGTFAKIPDADMLILGNSGEPTFDNKDDQQVLIDYFLEGGKGIGYHAAGDNSSYWKWIQDVLHSQADFNGHGRAKFSLATDPAVNEHPGLKKMWETYELGEPTIEKTEIYKFTKYPRGKDSVTIMQKVKPPNNVVEDHEFTWLRDIGKGQYIYTALGHSEADFKGGWLKKATWAWMEFLDGKFNETTGCMDSTATNYDKNANTACVGCCQYAPCCATAGFAETNPLCKNHQVTMCRTTGVSQLELNSSLVNISSEKVSIFYPNQWEVKVLNVAGETVLSESNSGVYEYSLSELQAGLYFVKVSAAGHSVSKRILIQ